MKDFSIQDVAKGTTEALQHDYDNLQEIEGHLGGNWMDEYPRIKQLRGEDLRAALQEIVDNLQE